MSKISILVPTLNRSRFAIRLIRYYAAHRFDGVLMIGDSSTPDHQERTRAEIERLKDQVKVIHENCSTLDAAHTFQRLNSLVETPYVAFVGDDDFLIPTGLEACAAFLDANLDYGAAHGTGKVCVVAPDSVYGDMTVFGDYPQPILEQETATERLQKYLEHYTVSLFSVHRTENWRIMWQDSHLASDRSFADELLPCCLSAVLSKIRQLDCPYLLRQDHPQRTELKTSYDWFTQPAWYPSFQVVIQSLGKTLVQKDGINQEQGEKIAYEAFRSYLTPAPPPHNPPTWLHYYLRFKALITRKRFLAPAWNTLLKVLRPVILPILFPPPPRPSSPPLGKSIPQAYQDIVRFVAQSKDGD